MPVLLRNLQQSVRINKTRLKRTAEAILAAAHIENAELSFVLVSDRRIRALNARYRHKDRPTDVLAFPISDLHPTPSRPSPLQGKGGCFLADAGRAGEKGEGKGGGAPILLGDVVISMPAAKRQAAECGHSLYDEVVRLLVHGLLHLLGYDHERSAQEGVRMARRERAILRVIHTSRAGAPSCRTPLPNPYHGRGPRPAGPPSRTHAVSDRWGFGTD